jgi:hypothetical protein
VAEGCRSGRHVPGLRGRQFVTEYACLRACIAKHSLPCVVLWLVAEQAASVVRADVGRGMIGARLPARRVAFALPVAAPCRPSQRVRPAVVARAIEAPPAEAPSDVPPADEPADVSGQPSNKVEGQQAVAHLNFVRGSPTKVRRVLNVIRGRTYEDALRMLTFMPYRCASWHIAMLLFSSLMTALRSRYWTPCGTALAGDSCGALEMAVVSRSPLLTTSCTMPAAVCQTACCMRRQGHRSASGR